MRNGQQLGGTLLSLPFLDNNNQAQAWKSSWGDLSLCVCCFYGFDENDTRKYIHIVENECQYRQNRQKNRETEQRKGEKQKELSGKITFRGIRRRAK